MNKKENTIKVSETAGYKRIKENTLKFVDAMKIGEKPGKYRKEKGGDASFYGSYHAAHILDLFGELDALSKEARMQWGESFLEHQTDQGYFSNNSEDLKRDRNLREMNTVWHYTRGHIWALRILGIKPKRAFRFLEPLFEKDVLYNYIKGYDWSNSWAAGNQVCAIATALMALRDWFDYQEVDTLLEQEMLPALEELQDKETGFWGTQFGSDFPNALFGTIHVTPVYFAQGWELGFVEACLDSTLACQLEDGSFWQGGSECPDYDGAYMMANLGVLTDHREEDLREACRHYLSHALMHEDPDGGWLLHRKDSKPFDWIPRPHWIWKEGESKVSVEYRDDDPKRTHIMLGSWFYPLSIALVSRYLKDTGYEGPYRFNRDSLHLCNVEGL